MLKNRPLLLILACLVLAALVVLDNWHEDRPAPNAAAPAGGAALTVADDEGAGADTSAEEPASQEMPLDNPLAGINEAELRDWVVRPLFAPSRKRPAKVAESRLAAPTLDARQAATSFDLLGILREGEHAIALLRSKGAGRSFRVEVGDMIAGWRVARMEPTSVLLEREDGTSQTVPLARD